MQTSALTCVKGSSRCKGSRVGDVLYPLFDGVDVVLWNAVDTSVHFMGICGMHWAPTVTRKMSGPDRSARSAFDGQISSVVLMLQKNRSASTQVIGVRLLIIPAPSARPVLLWKALTSANLRRAESVQGVHDEPTIRSCTSCSRRFPRCRQNPGLAIGTHS